MIICLNKMEYPLRSQCQRVQKQMMVNGEKERVSLLVMKKLVSRGSVDAVSQQMASHPQYLESFLRTQHYILHMDGPLPLPYRHYIAIMAAARHHCNYLVYLHSAQFLRVGGDPQWLQGLEAAPPRLRLLDHINKVLAHQPWLTTCSHIQTLLKAGEQCWSLAELVQAVVILAHCHSLCSFVFGCNTDSNFVPLAKSPNGNSLTFCPFDAANGNTSVPPAAPSEHIARRRSLDSSCDMVCLKEKIQKSQEEQERRDERFLQTQTLQQTDMEEEEEMMCFADPSRFITDADFCYQEFARRDEDRFQVLRVQDYSWEDHGFSLVNRLYSDIGHLLDDRFRSVATLPSMHSPDLKRAIWNYIHCVLGIRYDDYDYGEVNQLLARDLKLYIKAVACYPDATKTLVCPLSWTLLKASERYGKCSSVTNYGSSNDIMSETDWLSCAQGSAPIMMSQSTDHFRFILGRFLSVSMQGHLTLIHVNLLIVEARLQAELLYALRAITQYMIA